MEGAAGASKVQSAAFSVSVATKQRPYEKGETHLQTPGEAGAMLARQPGVVGRFPVVSVDGTPAQVDVVTDFVASNPALIILLVFLLGFVFFAFLFVRRTLSGLREGYDEGYRGK